MRNVTLERELDAPRSAVWAVLADYPNIADWNEGIKASYATSEATEGVGASRHCDLAPMGALEETVRAWEPEGRLVVFIDEAARLPMKRAEMTFTLTEVASGRTGLSMSYDYHPSGGRFAPLVGRALDQQFTKGFTGFMEQLEVAAKARTST